MARPKTGTALTAAERMRRYRARREAQGLRARSRWIPRTLQARVLEKRDLLQTLARAHGATSLDLFGSAARGDERPDSDLDFVVEMEPGRSVLDLIGLAQDLEAVFERKVDVACKDALEPRMRANVERDAVRIV